MTNTNPRAAIVFGSTGGATEEVATEVQGLLQDALGFGAELLNIRDTDPAALLEYDLLFIGSSTWNWGDLQDDWESALEAYSALDFAGKTVAFFGCGDSYLYGDTFGDAIGILATAATENGAKLVGAYPADEYDFVESKALQDGKMVGVMLDQDNEPEKTTERLQRWLSGVAAELS